MGTIASRPAWSASLAAASVFSHVGMRISGTKLMFGMVFVQNVPSFSLLSLKMGFVEFFTREIVPDILAFAKRPRRLWRLRKCHKQASAILRSAPGSYQAVGEPTDAPNACMDGAASFGCARSGRARRSRLDPREEAGGANA